MARLRATRRFLAEFTIEEGEVLEVSEERARRLIRKFGKRLELAADPEALPPRRPLVRGRMASPTEVS